MERIVFVEGEPFTRAEVIAGLTAMQKAMEEFERLAAATPKVEHLTPVVSRPGRGFPEHQRGVVLIGHLQRVYANALHLNTHKELIYTVAMGNGGGSTYGTLEDLLQSWEIAE